MAKISIRQLLRQIKPWSRVEVIWKDIKFHEAWLHVSDIPKDNDGLAVTNSLGYFLSYTNNVMSLAQSRNDEEYIAERLCIPVDVIEEVRII